MPKMNIFLKKKKKMLTTVHICMYIYNTVLYIQTYHIIPLHSRDYLKKTSIQINVATDKGNSQNEIGH